MEEIRGTETLEREILDDARKRAERIVRKANDDAASLRAQAEQKLKDALDALSQEFSLKRQRAEQELRSRLPLEKMRLDIEYRDARLREATKRAVAALTSEALGRWCVTQLSRQKELIQNDSVKVRARGLDAGSLNAIRALFSKGSSSEVIEVAEGARMNARGLVVEPADGSYHITITEAELIEWLLDEKRGELAAVLFGSAK